MHRIRRKVLNEGGQVLMRVVGEHRLVKAKEQINQSIQDNRKIKTDEIQYQMNVSHKRQR